MSKQSDPHEWLRFAHDDLAATRLLPYGRMVRPDAATECIITLSYSPAHIWVNHVSATETEQPQIQALGTQALGICADIGVDEA